MFITCEMCGCAFDCDAAGRPLDTLAQTHLWAECPECGAPANLPAIPDRPIVCNLTPHEVVVMDRAGETVICRFPPSGTVARCTSQREVIGSINNIPINRTTFGAVSGLPDPEPGVYYIVSALVAQALPEREDLLIPDDTVRDEAGRIIGCRAFARVR
ncbi:MAG: hypothetical protein CW346_18740 [Bacillaceae bacterium]|nr:hypothetical protein [Bacillaceae bacterium]